MKSEIFQTSRFSLNIKYDEQIGEIILCDKYTQVNFADSTYRYSAVVESDGVIRRLQNLNSPKIIERISDRGGRIVIILGKLGENDDKIDIEIEHRFFIPDEEEYIEERIVLRNLGKSVVRFIGYRFGMRKKLVPSSKYDGVDIDISNYRMIAVPFRQSADGSKHDYQIDDLYQGLYQYSAPKGFERSFDSLSDSGRERSEAWAWTDGENGLLITKYNPNMIEYSMLESQPIDSDIYLNFGGAAPCLFKEPEEASKLNAGAEIAFGKTRYHFYEGLWRRGYFIFREYLASLGHGKPDYYDPPIFWETNSAKNIDFDAVKQMGVQSVVIGKGWETSVGSTIWNDDANGNINDIVAAANMHEIGLGLKVVGRSYQDSYRNMYRRTLKGNIGFCNAYDGQPFWEPCYPNKRFKAEKEKRLTDVIKYGFNFLRFADFDWRGPCVEQTHDHPIPTTPGIHSSAVVDLIHKLKSANPNLLVEISDTVWANSGRYLPIYYLHNNKENFDEINAFGFAGQPLDDLLSGKALCLFYYNLAYDMPLSICMDLSHDNQNMLAFWWFASTVKHLGFSGNIVADERIKSALQEYKQDKTIYTQGVFYGIDELTHFHVLADSGECLINAFNLTEKIINREIEIRPAEFGIFDEICVEEHQCTIKGGTLVVNLQIQPFSSLRIRMKSKE